MNNSPESLIQAIGNSISIAAFDVYQNFGQNDKYRVQDALYEQPNSYKDFFDSWSIEIPGSTVIEADRFEKDGQFFWNVIYMVYFSEIVHIVNAKYWQNHEPDISIHAFPF